MSRKIVILAVICQGNVREFWTDSNVATLIKLRALFWFLGIPVCVMSLGTDRQTDKHILVFLVIIYWYITLSVIRLKSEKSYLHWVINTGTLIMQWWVCVTRDWLNIAFYSTLLIHTGILFAKLTGGVILHLIWYRLYAHIFSNQNENLLVLSTFFASTHY